MSGSSMGYIKGKSGFGKKGYKPGSMISEMNKKKGMTASASNGVGRIQKANLSKIKKYSA